MTIVVARKFLMKLSRRDSSILAGGVSPRLGIPRVTPRQGRQNCSDKYLVAAFCAALLGPGFALAAGPAPGDLQQSATRQEQIRGDSLGLVARLDNLIAEYTRNGLAKGKEYDDVKNVRETLGTLSDEEMEKVVTLLNDAAAKSPDSTGGAVKAYATGKDIVLRLKQILAAHQRKQDIDALASALSQLADRQAANLSTAVDVRQLALKDSSDDGKVAVAASEEAQKAEQTAIAGEVKSNADKLAAISSTPDGSAFKDAASQLTGLAPRAADATGALAAGRIDDAVAAETTVAEKLKDLAQALSLANDQDASAANHAGQLAGLARDEQALLGKTTQLNSTLYAPPKAAADAVAKAAANADATQKLKALSPDQSTLAAKAGMLWGDFQKTMGKAASPLGEAVSQMQAAQNDLARGDGGSAARAEEYAANQLAEAANLAGQMDAPEPAATGTRQQQLQRLQGQATELASREAASIQQGDARKTGPAGAAAVTGQQDMAEKAGAMQQAAAALGSASAQSFQQAAAALASAAQRMQEGGIPNIAQSAQQDAARDLGNAARQLAQETANASQDQRQLGTMAGEMKNLSTLIDRQRQVTSDTEESAQQGGSALKNPRALEHQQANVRKEADATRKRLGADTPEVALPLDQADAAMGHATDQLSADSPQQAVPAQKAALAALYKAQDAFADKIVQKARELGLPVTSPKALANVEAQLAKTQDALASAQNALNSANPILPNARVQLTAAERRAAQAGGEPQVLPQPARDAIRKADDAAGDAAASASSGNQQQAQAQSGEAAQAVAAAQAALGQVQSGIGDLASSSSSGQSGQSQSQSQGQSPGQSGQSNSQSTPGSQASLSGGGAGANEKTWRDKAGDVTAGPQGGHGAAQFLGLPQRDRAAAQQSQSEKYPQEYGSMIEEYMRSLANDSGEK